MSQRLADIHMKANNPHETRLLCSMFDRDAEGAVLVQPIKASLVEAGEHAPREASASANIDHVHRTESKKCEEETILWTGSPWPLAGMQRRPCWCKPSRRRS